MGKPARWIRTERPRCPNCRSVLIRTYKTISRPADESILRYVRCDSCGWKGIHVAA